MTKKKALTLLSSFLKEWMAESVPLKKSSNIKEWMVQADPPKEANCEKNGWAVATPLFKYSNTLL